MTGMHWHQGSPAREGTDHSRCVQMRPKSIKIHQLRPTNLARIHNGFSLSSAVIVERYSPVRTFASVVLIFSSFEKALLLFCEGTNLRFSNSVHCHISRRAVTTTIDAQSPLARRAPSAPQEFVAQPGLNSSRNLRKGRICVYVENLDMHVVVSMRMTLLERNREM